MRILVVEDQPDLRRLRRACLEDEGYAVDSASDGDEGLTKALVWPFDVIILELMLPKLDGLSLRERLSGLRHRMPGAVRPDSDSKTCANGRAADEAHRLSGIQKACTHQGSSFESA